MDDIHKNYDGINGIMTDWEAEFYQQTAEARYGSWEWE